MANIAKKEMPNKAFQKLSQLVSLNKVPGPIRDLLQNFTPYQIYDALNYYHPTIDFSANNLEKTIQVHDRICNMKDIFLHIHCITEGLLIENHSNTLEQYINDLMGVVEDKNTSLYLARFLRYNKEQDSFCFEPLLAMQEAFLVILLQAER